MAPELVPASVKPIVCAKPVTMPSRAYVTFLAGNGDYVKGVVGLAKGLRKVKTAYPLVVAVLPDVPETHRQILVSQGCIVREIEPVYPPENHTQFAMAYYVINYSKLRIWEVRKMKLRGLVWLCLSYTVSFCCAPMVTRGDLSWETRVCESADLVCVFVFFLVRDMSDCKKKRKEKTRRTALIFKHS